VQKSSAIVALAVALALPAYAVGDQQPSRSGPAGKGATTQFHRYQVAAGTALLLKLSTPLASATAKVDDQVDAVLWSPVVQDGVELIPVGSVAMGKVISVVRASERTPIGSVTFQFTVIKHAGTGDIAMVTSRKLVVEATREPRAKRGRGKNQLKVAEAVIPAGTPVVAMTAKPLIVLIPR
jgi:hypothetical protein